MSRMSRMGRVTALVAASALLLLPAAGATGAPTAQKSGAIINYLTTGKLKISKKIVVPFQCAVQCDVVSTLTIKGPGVKGSDTETGTLGAGVPSGHFIKPSGTLLKLMRANVGKFKIVSNATATDPATGATDQISHAFKLKR